MSALPDIVVNETPLEPMFSVNSLAAYLSVTPRTVRNLIARGELPSYLVAGARRIARSDVESYLQARREGGHDG